MNPEISVIIPCLNEVNTIGSVISAASEELSKAGFEYEIILVDNGSSDGSDHAAKSQGANVIHSEAKTIAGVRNAGVEISKGQVLVFLDADIVVQPGWGQPLKTVYDRMMENDNFIAGSQPLMPDNLRPMLYSWYKALSEDKRDTHLGTGHMIVSKNTFNRIGGFDETLATNEDFYFCYEGKKKGINVVTMPEMKVYHLGYPNTLIDFAKREIWHGSGYCNNLKLLFKSRVAWSGIIFLILNTIAIISFFTYLPTFLFSLTASILMASGINFFKFGYGNLNDFIHRSIISYIYLISRGLSLPIYFLMKNKNHYWAHGKKA